MGFRFRDRIRLFPGIKLNLSKTGISTSLGVPGATLNLGRKKPKVTVGIPGTGLSYQTHLRGKKSVDGDAEETNNDEVADDVKTQRALKFMAIVSRILNFLIVLILGAFAVIGIIFTAIFAVIISATKNRR